MAMDYFTPMGASTLVSATGSSVPGAFVTPSGANVMHVANTSATLYVSIAHAVSSAVATLGGNLTLPPMRDIIIAIHPQTASVAAIGSAAGPTAVVFTPGRAG